MKRGFGRRRTVLQLNSEERKQPTYGFGYRPSSDGENQKPEGALTALSGLMSQYAADDDDDDNNQNDDVDDGGARTIVTASDEKAVFKSNGAGKSNMPLKKFIASTEPLPGNLSPGPSKSDVGKDTKSVPPSGHPLAVSSSLLSVVDESAAIEGEKQTEDGIDDKLRDFLAEIESIDVEPADNVDVRPVEKETTLPTDAATTSVAADEKQDSKVKCKVVKESGESEEEARSSEDERRKLPPPIEPIAPVTPWQHCLDDSTQCYYYWNMETNEVTWEIPAEFSQYLLRLKQYEEQLAKYEPELAMWKRQHKKLKKRKHHKHSKHESSGTSSAPNDQTAASVNSDRDPPGAVVITASTNQSEALAEDGSVEVRGICKRLISYDSDSVTDDGAEVPAVSSSNNLVDSGAITTKTCADSDNTVFKKSGDDTGNRKSSHSSRTKHKKSSKKKTRKQSSDGDKAIARKKNSNKPLTKELDDEMVAENLQKGDSVDNYSTAEDNDEGFDIDAIDRELEQALDRHHGKAARVSTEQELASLSTDKRPVPQGAVLDSRTVGAEMAPLENDATYRLTRDDVEHRTRILAEIMELSADILDKLHNVGAYRRDLSLPYILLLQTQTRIQDWKAGGLDSDYLLRQLVETSGELARCQVLSSQLACHQVAGGTGVSCASVADDEGWVTQWDSCALLDVFG